MKPHRNFIYCVASKKSKILFESQNKADNFIKFNAAEIEEENEKAPVRIYYCQLCCGWHVTSNPLTVSGESLDRRDQRMLQQLDDIHESKDRVKEISHTIFHRMKDFDLLLNLCRFSDAEDVLDLCALDLDDIRSISPNILLHNHCQEKVFKAKERYNHVLSLAKLSEEEQERILQLEEPTKAQRKDIAMIKTIRAVDNINSVLNMKELLITCKDVDLVNDILNQCRLNIENIGGTGGKPGRNYWITELNDVIRERNKYFEGSDIVPLAELQPIF